MSQSTNNTEDVRILSLDGGDGRCISQLYILREYMHRISHDLNHEVSPSDHFHLITAVGPAGVIAILLGILKMSVDDTIATFARICQEVYPVEGMDAVSRSAKLRGVLTSILKEHDIDPNVLLSQVGGTNICLGYSSTSSMATWRAFRNYPSRQYSYEPPLIDAICACWAITGLFQAIAVGSEVEKDDAISAEAAYPNPTVQAVQEASEIYGADKHVGLLLSLGSGMSSRIVPGGEFKLIQTEVTSRELERRFGTTGVYYRLSVVPSLAAATEMTQEIVGVISAHTSDYLQNPVTDRLLDQVAKTRSRASRFTLRSMSETTAPPKVSMAGLPPLSPYFVQREVPMNHMDVALLCSEEKMRQRLSIITGMGGSGSDLSSALKALSEPNEMITTRWCLIFDNADDSDLDITSFLPTCDHGAIIITTRNAQLEFISPEGHIALEVMNKSEACDALLASALGPTEKHTPRQKEQAMAIVKEFEYLPIAVVQAGCYIRKHKCLETYLKRLETSRSELLKQTTVQRDKLRYKHSVYAAFDTSLSSLSERALGLLSILCFFHYTGFPRSMIGLAASKNFSYEEHQLMDRGSDFQESVDLLRRLIVPTGRFEEIELDQIIEELQQLSLITLVSLYSDIRLRFHPLLHAWAYDRQSAEENRRNKAAALRLLTCVVDQNDAVDIEPELYPHARRFVSEIDTPSKLRTWEQIYEIVRTAHGDEDLRTSDALIGFALGLEAIPDYPKMERLLRGVLELRRSISGPKTALTAEAMYWLATCLGNTKDGLKESLDLLRAAYDIQVEVLGVDHIQTQWTMISLTDVLLSRQENYSEARPILEELLDIRIRLYGSLHSRTLDTAKALVECYAFMGVKKEGKLDHLLQIYYEGSDKDRNYDVAVLAFQGHMHELQGKYQEAEDAYRESLEANSRLYGQLSRLTLYAVLDLANILWKQNRNTELETLLRRYARTDELQGIGRLPLLRILQILGSCLNSQSRYVEAQKFLSEALDGMVQLYGEMHFATHSMRRSLANCHFKQKHYDEAELLHRKNMECIKEAQGEEHTNYIRALTWLARCIYEQKKFEESEKLWKDIYLRMTILLGPYHPEPCTALSWLIECLQMRELFDQAASHIPEMMRVYRILDGGEKSQILLAHLRVGKVLERQRMFTEAEEVFRAHITCVKKFHGDAGPDSARALDNLARVLFDQGRYDESKTIREDQMRRWSELQDKKEQEFISEKLQQIEVAFVPALGRSVAIICALYQKL
ncbi:SubName: Full=Uncharacterized protein {ECO:0000313/EMBL:CCA76006.1} [Serendipita indica DSM 11827]|nr:SubName: Full=Uncharacterized protein {ECO:0000313/EMBL:CCA76006.1} [Serendipita indica DSM 11827]